ncbi:MAG: Prenylcys lyase protein [Thermoproteota archaeon]|nr:Prenylcys lyase protein [Thermoproteota archaeon]
MVNLAIIGAGVGGCAAAFFASKIFPNLKVTIFDLSDRVGGRVLTQAIGSMKLELGAAFFNTANKTVLNVVEDLGLKVREVEERADFGIWNGSDFLLKSNKNIILTLSKLFLRYGLNIVKMQSLLKEIRGQVKNLYEAEQKNPVEMNELFKFAGLDGFYRKKLDEILAEWSIDESFINEVITPITRIIYSQNADMGGFAGLSSLISVYTGKTYNFIEGNSVFPKRLMNASNSELLFSQNVRSIEKKNDGSYRISVENKTSTFDGVIIATPLELTGLALDGISMTEYHPREYRRVYIQVIQGKAIPSFFGSKDTGSLPRMILTTSETKQIMHIATLRLANGEDLMTISSTELLPDDILDGMIRNRYVILEHSWNAAYPLFKPIDNIPHSRLDERLMYLNSLESAVSSMETSVFSALNAIRMMKDELR